ncbi:hypothetical protein [Pseudomonas poae]|uniref:hypothetical protein n=1 Tax=Pseudomonas poae TaxID=200451 RepID=UPI001472CE2F|nr:hypothetical protein [Pseudomonas poae]NMZ50184.1 hypothetical protein [Pseudomonas poae]
MKKPTSVSRRIHSCLQHISENEHEQALIHFFPALDKTAKKRRPKLNVGARFKAFLSDEEGIISLLALNHYIVNVRVDGYTFPEAIYKFGRNCIAHEGELDPRLNFNNEFGMQIGFNWNLPPSYISALAIIVMTAPENENEFIDSPASITLFDRSFPINDLWGAKDELEKLILKNFEHYELIKSMQAPK